MPNILERLVYFCSSSSGGKVWVDFDSGEVYITKPDELQQNTDLKREPVEKTETKGFSFKTSSVYNF